MRMKPLIGSDGRQRALAIGSNFIQAHSVYSSEICSPAATEKTPHTYIGTTSRVQRQDPDPHTPTCEPPKNPAQT